MHSIIIPHIVLLLFDLPLSSQATCAWIRLVNKIIGHSNGSIVTSLAKLDGTQDTTITGTQVIRPVVMGTEPLESSRLQAVLSKMLEH